MGVNIGGDDMAFVMAPSMSSDGAFPSQFLGLLNATNNNMLNHHLFAIEFDTLQVLEFIDIDDNHPGFEREYCTAPVGSPHPSIPLISMSLDLWNVFEEQMYAGFTAATGVLSGTHRLLAWRGTKLGSVIATISLFIS
ncbi:hypothetical protein L7F22_033423 [Adiantum nelumboides]|nr:hypothetical protein [Adiantum nelumboides]